MWAYSPVEVKLIKVISFHRSGIHPCCEILLCNIVVERITSEFIAAVMLIMNSTEIHWHNFFQSRVSALQAITNGSVT